MTTKSVDEKAPGLSLLATGAGLTVTLLAAYIVCWLAYTLSGGVGAFAHNWLNLFSAEPLGSVNQLLEGATYSAISAWFAALVFAPVYNLVARTDRII
ncbi:MAG: hypothetical protein DCF16_18490 [Alphaproteobacteria bacterium]|nr:MAG: hypothetical protein DCF16_18490 [Alphaproteobacteria bacterium]